MDRVTVEHRISELESMIESEHTPDVFIPSNTTSSELEVIFNNSAIAIIYVMRDRRFSRVNQRFCDLMGYHHDEIIGKTAEFMHISKESFKNFATTYFPKLNNGEIVKTEYRYRKKNGDIIWCSVWGHAVNPKDLEGGIIWILDDITERKHLEQLKEDVERMMHHDLKNPLGNIMMLQSLLKNSNNLSPQEKKYVEHIEDASNEIKRLIDIPLDLFKMETGKYKMEPGIVDLIDVIEKASLDKHFFLTEDIKHSVQIFLNGKEIDGRKEVNITSEEHLCYNMFCNLIANAKEASIEDEVISVYITDGSRIDVTIHNKTPVPVKIRDHFFEKYCTEGKKKGTGLGTYSAKLIAETLGAIISMHTSDEDGTRVTVSFPK